MVILMEPQRSNSLKVEKPTFTCIRRDCNIYKTASVKQFTSCTTIFRNLYSDILSSLPVTPKSVKHNCELHSPIFVHV